MVMTKRLLAMMVVMMIAAAAVSAIGPAPLPVVNVTDVDGRVTPLSAFAREGNWLMIYVRPNCDPCMTVLRTVESDDAVAERTLVVVGGGAGETLERIAADYRQIPRTSWFRDSGDGLAQALAIEQAPVILAVSDRTIQWSLSGVISGRNRIRNVMANWIDW